MRVDTQGLATGRADPQGQNLGHIAHAQLLADHVSIGGRRVDRGGQVFEKYRTRCDELKSIAFVTNQTPMGPIVGLAGALRVIVAAHVVHIVTGGLKFGSPKRGEIVHLLQGDLGSGRRRAWARRRWRAEDKKEKPDKIHKTRS